MILHAEQFQKSFTGVLLAREAVLAGCGNNESDTSSGNVTNSGEEVLTVSIKTI